MRPLLNSRRALLQMIGMAAGSSAMYFAMSELGYATSSTFKGPPKLSGQKPGTSVLVLGAGIAGMVAAIELRDAGYDVKVLEYNDRAGGRNWTLYGGDTFTELGGHTQKIEFAAGQYFNPGPWRIPYHHQGILHYIQRLGVALEPFTQVNFNAFVHSQIASDGKPRRIREVYADFHGHVAELLAKCTTQSALDQDVTKEDRERLLIALKDWGALDSEYRYAKGLESAERRGYEKDPGGGLDSVPLASEPLALREILKTQTWAAIGAGCTYDLQSAIFQPKGGMGAIGKAFGEELRQLIQYNCKVTRIRQDETGVTVSYTDRSSAGEQMIARADWCVCTIPASILGQIPLNVGGPLKAAIDQLAYSPGLKVGLQFKRRFWEQDDQIYGGMTYTDLPNRMIGYPQWDYFSRGRGVLLGSYAYGEAGFVAASKPPEERIRDSLEYGAKIHPQYKSEFECGVAVAWHRVPWALGCAGMWSEQARQVHYDNLCALDGRIVLAGEHASRLPAWQEGSVTSAIDAIERLHKRVMAG